MLAVTPRGRVPTLVAAAAASCSAANSPCRAVVMYPTASMSAAEHGRRDRDRAEDGGGRCEQDRPQSLHIGYFLTRYVFAPDRKWDDASQIEKTADILIDGISRK
jgi:hypothetical protein